MIYRKDSKPKTHKDLVEIGYRWLLRTKSRNCVDCL